MYYGLVFNKKTYNVINSIKITYNFSNYMHGLYFLHLLYGIYTIEAANMIMCVYTLFKKNSAFSN